MYKTPPDSRANSAISTGLAIFLLVSTVLITGCNPARRSTEAARSENLKSEDFEEFYDRFHADSAFQMSRIKFPLGGMSVDGSGRQEWTRDNWYLMKVRIYDVDTSLYKVSYTGTVREFKQKIWVEDSGFSSEYRFALIEGSWYLVYVLDQNL